MGEHLRGSVSRPRGLGTCTTPFHRGLSTCAGGSDSLAENYQQVHRSRPSPPINSPLYYVL